MTDACYFLASRVARSFLVFAYFFARNKKWSGRADSLAASHKGRSITRNQQKLCGF